MKLFLLTALTLAPFAHAAPQGVIADMQLLEKAGAVMLAEDATLGVGYALVDEKQQEKLSRLAHAQGKCGGFEVVNAEGVNAVFTARAELRKLSLQAAREKSWKAPLSLHSANPNPVLQDAIGELREENLRDTVVWLSSYPNRYNKGSNPNRHVEAMAEKLRAQLARANIPWTLDLISHNRTRQKSIRVRFTGSTRPSEIVVLGGHLDSISWGGSAPGADDNASGSAALLEAMRVFVEKGQPERTVEFFWYAGEESGLLGSAEIAAQYKEEHKDVIAVMQLDMTMFPGSGEFVIMNTADYTSAWLRSYLLDINTAYLGYDIQDDKCGYGCSDHASWHRQGYPTFFPFEALFDNYNHDIHTADDVITERSSFRHALGFSKIALLFALDMGNSTLRQPY